MWLHINYILYMFGLTRQAHFSINCTINLFNQVSFRLPGKCRRWMYHSVKTSLQLLEGYLWRTCRPPEPAPHGWQPSSTVAVWAALWCSSTFCLSHDSWWPSLCSECVWEEALGGGGGGGDGFNICILFFLYTFALLDCLHICTWSSRKKTPPVCMVSSCHQCPA